VFLYDKVKNRVYHLYVVGGVAGSVFFSCGIDNFCWFTWWPSRWNKKIEWWASK